MAHKTCRQLESQVRISVTAGLGCFGAQGKDSEWSIKQHI